MDNDSTAASVSDSALLPSSSSPTSPPKNPALAIAALAIALQKQRKMATSTTKTTYEDTSLVIGAGGGEGNGSSSSSSSSSLSSSDVHKNHPYFHYYGLLIHQQNMLQDLVRTGAYHDAFMHNAADFKDKVVVDVGTGSGILAWFAIKAGAKKVYAIEASDVADRAKELMKANGMEDKIVVLKQTVESVELPEKVDIIVSEPMGFMLIHERMLESYIIARTKFLKPGGLMFPTTGTIYTAPFTDATLWQEQSSKVNFWYTTDFYGLDLSSLADSASKDHFSQPVVGYIDPSCLLSTATSSPTTTTRQGKGCDAYATTVGHTSVTTVNHTIDFSKDDPSTLHVIDIPFEFVAARTGVCHGLAAWFDVSFMGSRETYVLNTGPYAAGTHWYQCRLLLREPIAVNAGQKLSGTLHCVANARYSYNMTLNMKLVGSEATTESGVAIESAVALNLHDQMYHYLNNASYGK